MTSNSPSTTTAGLFHVTIAAALLVCLALAAPMLFGWIYTASDLGAYYFPVRWFHQQTLDRGQECLWMPHLRCGHYVHAEMGLCHPAYFLLYSLLPLCWAFNVEVFLSYPVMLAGMYLLLRFWRLPNYAAMFGSLSFAFSGFALLHSVHVNVTAVIAHIPWLLLGINLLLRSDNSRRTGWAALAIALLTASQALLGHPHYVYLSLLVESIYFLLVFGMTCAVPALRDSGLRRDCIQKLGWMLGAKTLGGLLAAIRLIPMLDLLANSNRGIPDPSFRFAMSMQPEFLLQLAGPYFYNGHFAYSQGRHLTLLEYGMYNGALGFLLTAWCAWRFRRLGTSLLAVVPWRAERSDAELECARPRLQFLVTIAGIMAFLGMVLALGENSIPYRIVSQLPLLRSFRIPCRHILLVDLGMAIIAGVAFWDVTTVCARRETPPWRRLWILAALVSFTWAAAILLLFHRSGLIDIPGLPSYFMASPGELLISPMLVTLGGLLLVFAARGKRLALAGMVVFAATDQACFGLQSLWTSPPIQGREFQNRMPDPPERDGYRYANLDYDSLMDINGLTAKGYENTGGYVAMPAVRNLVYTEAHPGALKASGTRWLWMGWEQGTFRGLWKELPDPAPPLRLVTSTLVSENPVSEIDSIDLASTALVSEKLELEPGVPGEAVLRHKEPGLLEGRTESSSRQLLVVSESYHSGWKVEIDGTPGQCIRVNGDFIGCVVDAGSHDVRLYFDPFSYRLGKALSYAGIILAIGVTIALVYTRRPLRAWGSVRDGQKKSRVG